MRHKVRHQNLCGGGKDETPSYRLVDFNQFKTPAGCSRRPHKTITLARDMSLYFFQQFENS